MTLTQKIDIILLKYNKEFMLENEGAIPEWEYNNLQADILLLFKSFNPEREDFGIGIDKLE